MIIKNVNVLKLHKEFVLANIHPYPVLNLGGGDGDFAFVDGTDMDLVQQIIDAHDPTSIPSQPSETEVLTNYLLDVDMRLVMVEMGLL